MEREKKKEREREAEAKRDRNRRKTEEEGEAGRPPYLGEIHNSTYIIERTCYVLRKEKKNSRDDGGHSKNQVKKRGTQQENFKENEINKSIYN